MKILVLHEKHGDRHFLFGKTAETEAEELQNIAISIFKDREAEGWYEEDGMDSTEKRYYKAALTGDTKAALTFMKIRDDAEYEGFSIEEPEE